MKLHTQNSLSGVDFLVSLNINNIIIECFTDFLLVWVHHQQNHKPLVKTTTPTLMFQQGPYFLLKFNRLLR
jgi:hypothetical protein